MNALPYEIWNRIILRVLKEDPDFGSVMIVLSTCKGFSNIFDQNVGLVKFQEFCHFVCKKPLSDVDLIDVIKGFMWNSNLKILDRFLHLGILRVLSNMFVHQSDYDSDANWEDRKLSLPFILSFEYDLLTGPDLCHYISSLKHGKCPVQCEFCQSITLYLQTLDKIECQLINYHKSHHAYEDSITYDKKNQFLQVTICQSMELAHKEWLKNIIKVNYQNFILCYDICGERMITVILNILDPLIEIDDFVNKMRCDDTTIDEEVICNTLAQTDPRNTDGEEEDREMEDDY